MESVGGDGHREDACEDEEGGGGAEEGADEVEVLEEEGGEEDDGEDDDGEAEEEEEDVSDEEEAAAVGGARQVRELGRHGHCKIEDTLMSILRRSKYHSKVSIHVCFYSVCKWQIGLIFQVLFQLKVSANTYCLFHVFYGDHFFVNFERFRHISLDM